jgi:small-conductance mechanosensitive channel
LVRHPYDVGDRIAVSDVNAEAPPHGSSGWIVKDVDLFTTTVIYGTTNEVATYSNGSLALSRIINAARSPKASLFFLFKFPIDAPYERIKIFQTAIEKFIKARPREVKTTTMLSLVSSDGGV